MPKDINQKDGNGNLSISKFKSQVRGFSKTSLMHVTIDPPFSLLSKHAYDIEEYKYTCETSRLPGFIFKTENRLISGIRSEIPVGIEQERLSLTFLVRSDMQERKLFDDWFTLIQDPETFKLEYYQNYVGNLSVQTYNDSGKINYKVQYYNVYPLLITAQQLSWAETNVLRLTTEFAYEKWKQIPLDTEIKTRNDEIKDWVEEYKPHSNKFNYNLSLPKTYKNDDK